MCQEGKGLGERKFLIVVTFFLFFSFLISSGIVRAASPYVLPQSVSYSGVVTLLYDKSPYVFREQNTLLLIGVNESFGNHSVMNDTIVTLSLLNESYVVPFSSYYGAYAVSLWFFNNESYALVPYNVTAEKVGWGFRNLSGSFVLTNYSEVTVRLFRDVRGVRPYVFDGGYIFAVPGNSDILKIRNRQERVLSPLPALTVWGSRFFDMNYSVMYRYPVSVIRGDYRGGVAVLGLPSDADYSFFFVAGDFAFSSDYVQKPFYLSKKYDVYLGSVRLVEAEKDLSYQVSDWSLNWLALVIRAFLVWGLVIVSFFSVVFMVRATGDVTLLWKYLLSGVVFFPIWYLLLTYVLIPI